jgi:hypothetical protein
MMLFLIGFGSGLAAAVAGFAGFLALLKASFGADEAHDDYYRRYGLREPARGSRDGSLRTCGSVAVAGSVGVASR